MVSYQKQFIRCLVFSLFVQPVIVAHISYEQHKDWHIGSLVAQPDDTQKAAYNKEQIARLQHVYSILSARGTALPVVADQQQKEITISDLHKDLELFIGKGSQANKNILTSIDRTTSAAGSIMLRKLTSELSANSDPVRFASRQQFIQKLIGDEQLFQRVNTLCGSWAASEDRTLKNWTSSGVSEREVNKYLWMFPRLNKSTLALTAGIYVPLLTGLIYPLSFYIRDLASQAQFCYAHHGRENFTVTNWSAPNYGQIEQRKIGFVDSIVYACNHAVDPRHAINMVRELSRYLVDTANGKETSFMASPDLAFGSYQLISYGFLGYYFYQNVKDLQNSKNELSILQDRLMGMGDLVRSVATFKALVKDHPELTKALAAVQSADQALNNVTDKEFNNLIDMLASKTFQGEVSFFSNGGKIILAQKGVDEHKDKFVGAIELMGELDACLSLAKLIKESKDKPVGYCLAQLSDAQKPHVKLQQFWHPMLDPHKAVPNDLELGGQNNPQHVILTGSNTGGKSTVGLKSTMLALYLAHSLGIAPAAVCDASKGGFASYIHVNDDTGAGKSAFDAEVTKVASILKSIQQHKNTNIYVVIDELFRGAGSGPSEYGSYKVAEYIARHDNVISIIATHVPKLTELEEQTNGRCVNMKIDVHKDKDGNLIRPHKLERGVSDSNIAIDLMKRDLAHINFDN